MSGSDLGKLFSPRSVAIVGASESRHYSQSLIANLRQQGFSDSKIFPINPKYETVFGIKCFASLEEIGEVPDVVASLVGHDLVSGVIESAGKLGVGAALVIADGYADEGEEGKKDQMELGNLARSYGIKMLGPNTLGYILPATGAGMWCAGAVQTPLESGGVSVIAQSSGMLNVIMGMLGDRRVGVRACVSIGNAAVIGLPELVGHFAQDPETRVIAMVVESVDRPKEFAEALEAATRNGKAVVALKIGASEKGQQNSVAHTGRLSSPNQGWQSVFERVGVTQAFDIDDFLETATLFDGMKKERAEGGASGLGVAFATISGGETSLICDISDQEGLQLAPISTETLGSLRQTLDKSTLIGNPLDLQNSRTTRPAAFWDSLRTLVSDPSVDVMAIRLNMPLKPSPSLESLYGEIVELIRGAGKVPVVLSRAYERFDLSWWELFSRIDVTFVMSYRNSIKAMARFNRWLEVQRRLGSSPRAIPSETLEISADGSVSLPLSRARKWLGDVGIPYVPGGIADDSAGAAALADQLGYPVVVKAVMPNMVHKSDAGGVVLDLSDQKAVIAACSQMSERLLGGGGGGSLRFEVQKMMDEGVEIILGMKKDPTWGPLLMVGSGGIYAEILRDTIWILPPVSKKEALETLKKLRIWPVLGGARGREPADVDALSQLISSYSEALVRDGAWIDGMDLNPVIVGPKGGGAYVVDVAMFGDGTAAEEWSI